MIILDRNVLSEVIKPSPSSRVLRWLAGRPATVLFTTAITQAEILYGLELLSNGKRRAGLQTAIEAMFKEDFAGRILPFHGDAARVFPKIVVSRRSWGRPITQSDAQTTAIAGSRAATIATLSTGDFEHCSVAVVNPWAAE